MLGVGFTAELLFGLVEMGSTEFILLEGETGTGFTMVGCTVFGFTELGATLLLLLY